MAVGDCSVTERRRWRPPYQTGKTVHVHAKHYKHNKDGRTAPSVCGNGSVPLSHLRNVVTRIPTHTHNQYERIMDISNAIPDTYQINKNNKTITLWLFLKHEQIFLSTTILPTPTPPPQILSNSLIELTLLLFSEHQLAILLYCTKFCEHFVKILKLQR